MLSYDVTPAFAYPIGGHLMWESDFVRDMTLPQLMCLGALLGPAPLRSLGPQPLERQWPVAPPEPTGAQGPQRQAQPSRPRHAPLGKLTECKYQNK